MPNAIYDVRCCPGDCFLRLPMWRLDVADQTATASSAVAPARTAAHRQGTSQRACAAARASSDRRCVASVRRNAGPAGLMTYRTISLRRMLLWRPAYRPSVVRPANAASTMTAIAFGATLHAPVRPLGAASPFGWIAEIEDHPTSIAEHAPGNCVALLVICDANDLSSDRGNLAEISYHRASPSEKRRIDEPALPISFAQIAIGSITAAPLHDSDAPSSPRWSAADSPSCRVRALRIFPSLQPALCADT